MSSTIKPNASILIVEDETIVAKDIANKLGRLGYTVIGNTAQGEEALVLAREKHPDVVLMDVRLAGTMDGVETADRMRREGDVAVIYLTAHSDRVTLDRAKLTEPFGYILKPFEERDLETHIEMAIYRHQAERKLRESAEGLRQKSEELERSNKQLAYMNSLMVGRELRMIELKKEIDKLCRQFGQPSRYGYGGDPLPDAGQHNVQ
jgi:CheY-like chemotaxis protein